MEGQVIYPACVFGLYNSLDDQGLIYNLVGMKELRRWICTCSCSFLGVRRGTYIWLMSTTFDEKDLLNLTILQSYHHNCYILALFLPMREYYSISAEIIDCSLKS